MFLARDFINHLPNPDCLKYLKSSYIKKIPTTEAQNSLLEIQNGQRHIVEKVQDGNEILLKELEDLADAGRAIVKAGIK